LDSADTMRGVRTQLAINIIAADGKRKDGSHLDISSPVRNLAGPFNSVRSCPQPRLIRPPRTPRLGMHGAFLASKAGHGRRA